MPVMSDGDVSVSDKEEETQTLQKNASVFSDTMANNQTLHSQRGKLQVFLSICLRIYISCEGSSVGLNSSSDCVSAVCVRLFPVFSMTVLFIRERLSQIEESSPALPPQSPQPRAIQHL